MYIDTIIVTEIRLPDGTVRKPRTNNKVVRASCDECGLVFERQFEDRPARSGRSKSIHHFCSVKCRNVEMGRRGHARNQRIQVTCGKEGCGKVVEIKRCNVGRFKRAYCSKQCCTDDPKRYSESQSNTPEAWAKRSLTMKRNGTYRKSKAEDAYYERLCAQFGEVERQVRVPGKRWLIDFYVKSIDTYVQFDGVYWHGLDRPIEVIAEHKTSRDKQIHKKWITDRAQDLWFSEHGWQLLRVNEGKNDDGIAIGHAVPSQVQAKVAPRSRQL